MERQVNGDSDPRRVGETLSMMWIFVLFNYVYADIGTVFVIFTRPELLERLQSGKFGSFHLTEGFLLAGAVMMEICIAMIPLSWKLPRRANRIANILAGALFTAIILMTLFASGKVPPLNFYTFFQIVEIVSTATIVAIAWRWSAAMASRPERNAA
jgi:Family of unknown function (DUF6326)